MFGRTLKPAFIWGTYFPKLKRNCETTKKMSFLAQSFYWELQKAIMSVFEKLTLKWTPFPIQQNFANDHMRTRIEQSFVSNSSSPIWGLILETTSIYILLPKPNLRKPVCVCLLQCEYPIEYHRRAAIECVLWCVIFKGLVVQLKIYIYIFSLTGKPSMALEVS